ncbi:MAG: endonuclease [Muribaculaceae bacterium]|nr:endonuclease [Muribaculaceae bacterium]
MRKNLHYLLLLVVMAVGLQAVAAIPSGYYNNALGKNDQQLMSSLHQIINGHYRIYYGNLWEKFKTTDCNGNTIIDRYSTTQFTYSVDQCGTYNTIGQCYNREHSVPNSWWGGGSSDADTMYTDLYHMYPVDGWVNGQRGNNPFGDCANGTACGTGKLGSCTHSGYTGTVFEVADEYKGDFARTYFYMVVRYMDRVGSWTNGLGSVVFTNSSYKHLTPWAISQLLEWHRNDPVSTLESNRNEAVSGIQHNRNPFIDHPELAEYLWGNMTGNAWTGSATNTPILSSPANGSTINVGTNAGSGVSKTITVKGVYLTQALTVAVTGTGFSVTPTTLTAAAVNAGTTVTVTYNGTATNATGRLTISSSEVTSNVTLTATYNTGGGGGTETVETWEGCSSGGYWTQEIQGAAFKWYFSNAGLYARDNDHWNGSLGCCFGKNADSYIQMSEDVIGGASKLTFYAAKYGNDVNPTIKILYSTNAGSTWTEMATCTLNGTWQQYSYDLNVTGDVRFKFQQTAGSRLNVDDIAITSNSGSVATPELTAPVNGSTVNVGTITASGSSVSKTITVRGSNLTKALNVSVSGNGFSVTPTTISAASANNGTTVTVTYTSSTAGNATGTLTIASSEVSTTVNLTASKDAMPSLSISSLDVIVAVQNGSSEIESGSVSADNNSENIHLAVEGNFEISLNGFSWAQSLTLDPSGEVFYVRLKNTSTPGDYDGAISATTSLASAYADVIGVVEAQPVRYGDVNMDGSVSIADVTVLIDYLLGTEVSPFDTEAADVSHDGNISIADVTALIDLLLSGAANGMRQLQWNAVPVENGVFIVNPAGDELEVYDMDANCVATINLAGDCTIELPAGIYVVASETTSHKVVVK